MLESQSVRQTAAAAASQPVQVPAEGEGSVGLLPPPDSGAYDQLAVLEELLVKLRIEERGQARVERRAEEMRISQMAARQVEAIRERGDAQFAQGVAQGFGEMVGGVMGAYGGFADEKGWAELGTAVKGGGTFLAAWEGADVTVAEMHLAEAETARGGAERRAAEASTNMQNAHDDLRALLSAIQRIHDAELAAKKAAVFLA